MLSRSAHTVRSEVVFVENREAYHVFVQVVGEELHWGVPSRAHGCLGHGSRLNLRRQRRFQVRVDFGAWKEFLVYQTAQTYMKAAAAASTTDMKKPDSMTLWIWNSCIIGTYRAGNSIFWDGSLANLGANWCRHSSQLRIKAHLSLPTTTLHSSAASLPGSQQRSDGNAKRKPFLFFPNAKQKKVLKPAFLIRRGTWMFSAHILWCWFISYENVYT